MKKLNLFIVLMLISLYIFAQDQHEIEKGFVHEVGLAAGSTTGVGLSYRYWPQKLGIQTTFLPVMTSNFNYFSLGLAGLYKFHEGESSQFFVYLSNSITSTKIKNSFYGNEYTNRFYSIGFGPGFSFGNRISLNFMGGIALYFFDGETSLYPSIESGIFYRF